PFEVSALPIATVTLLIVLLQGADSARAAAWVGFAFGIGLFGAGASWVFVALNTYGGVPWVLASVGTAGVWGFIPVFAAAAGWLAARWTRAQSWQRALAAAAAWTLAEWAHTLGFASFPWLALGYAQLNQASATALVGFAPAGGVFAVTLAIALIAAALALALEAVATASYRRVVICVACALAVIGPGAALPRIELTTPRRRPVTLCPL